MTLLATEKHLTLDGLVFLLEWDVVGIADRHSCASQSCGGPTVEEYGNSDYMRPTTVGCGGTATVLRVQKANC